MTSNVTQNVNVALVDYLRQGFCALNAFYGTLVRLYNGLGKLAGDENSFWSKYFDPDRYHLDFIGCFNTL